MSRPIRVFIGHGGEPDAPAMRVLRHSILAHASLPVELHALPLEPKWKAQPDYPKQPGCWYTCFTAKRFAIPELCEFRGRAIYLDVDMALVSDIAELWNRATRAPWTCHGVRTDVSLIDCHAFAGKPWWPSIATMQESGWGMNQYRTLLHRQGFIDGSLGKEWDCVRSQDLPTAKLVHWTQMNGGQPWRPWPSVFDYPTTYPYCVDHDLGELWWRLHREADAAAPIADSHV